MDKIEHALYINLESRPDRRDHVERHLTEVGIAARRFNAVPMRNGAIGCSMSHLKCLKMAKEQGWPHVLIVEDDILFLDPPLFRRQFGAFLADDSIEWDVVLIAGNNVPPFERRAEYCVKVSQCQTTTGYMVKCHYFDTLIQNIREGVERLLKEPEAQAVCAIDKNWFPLQQRDAWYLITPLTVTQREDFSDIEQKVTNYTSVMLDLDKRVFYTSQLERVNQAICFFEQEMKKCEEELAKWSAAKAELESRLQTLYAN